MIIAVNTGFAGENKPVDEYVFQCLLHLAKKYPGQQFICITNKAPDKNLVFTKNIRVVISGTVTNNTLLWKYWYDYKLPVLLKKHKADVLVNMTGICSLRTKLPQCLLMADLSFLHYPQALKRSQVSFLKKFTPQFLAKAKAIVTVSEFYRSAIIDQYKTAADKIDLAFAGIDEFFKPLAQSHKEIIKEKYTEGREYFLSYSNNNLINLLKAFSFFKKRQKSNMMLIIAGKTDEQFTKELRSFKFRNEVKLLENLSKEELAKITATAYALVHPFFYDPLAMVPLQAMQCEVPVVCSGTAALTELCGDAVLYFPPDNFEDMAQKMMLIFKDEDTAKELVKAGKTLSQRHHWDKTADLLWRSIGKAVNG